MGSETGNAQSLAEEARLIAQAQAGDMHALRPLFARYADPLYASVILPRLRDRAAAEDVLTDTFTTALEKIGTFRWEGRSLFFWLRQIAVNKVMDVHRKAQRTGRMVDALEREVAGEAEAAARAGVEHDLIAEEARRRSAGRIAASLAAMSDRYREAIQLRLIDELPREACAQRMAITVGNFDVVLFRAVRAFRKLYGDPEET